MRVHLSITESRVLAAAAEAEADGSNPGFCVACGADADGIEPDAEKCVCEECNASAVYGVDQLLLCNMCHEG